MSSEEQSRLYHMYKDYGIIPLAAPCSFMMVAIAALGHFGNLSILHATVKNKTLQSPCNVLLAIVSFADSLHMITPFILACFIFTGHNFINILTCFYVQIVPHIGAMFSLQLTTTISIDRLFCVAVPSTYRRLNPKIYISFFILICTFYPAYVMFAIHTQAFERPNFQVICFIVESMPRQLLATVFKCQIILNVITVLCYVGLWMCIKFKTTEAQTSNRILKSVVIITVVLVLGWTVNAVVQTAVITMFQMPEDTAFFVELYFGLGPTSVCSVNYFILYFTSREYRAAFRRQLNGICVVCLRRKCVFADGSTAQVITVRFSDRSRTRNSIHG